MAPELLLAVWLPTALPTRELEPSPLAQDAGQALAWLHWTGSPSRPREKGLGITWLKSSSDPPLFPFQRMEN